MHIHASVNASVNVNWNKDRGLDANGSERVNDQNFTIAGKQAARRAAGQ